MKIIIKIIIIFLVSVIGFYTIKEILKADILPEPTPEPEIPISENSPWTFPSEDAGFQISELGEGINYYGQLGTDGYFVVLFSEDLSITENNFLQICFYKDNENDSDIIPFGFIINGGDMFAGSFEAKTEAGYMIHSGSLKTGWNVVTIKFSDILALESEQTIETISGLYFDNLYFDSYNGGTYYMFDVAAGYDPSLEE